MSQGDRRPRGRAWRRARRATSPGASRCSSRRRCRASSPTARRRTAELCELFIVEGTARAVVGEEGAQPAVPGDPADPREDPQRRARARMDKMLKNEEIQALITAIGTGLGEEFDVDEAALPQDHPADRRRRRRLAHPHAAAHVLLPPDAASSSSGGYVYVAQPPLYPRRARQDEDYLKDEAALTAFHAENEGRKPEVSRLQGPRRDGLRRSSGRRRWTRATRTLLQVSVEQAAIADEVFSILMGDDVESRQALHPAEREGRPLPRHLRRRSPRPVHDPHRIPGGDECLPDGQPTLGNVEPIEIQEEMERSFLDYAMSVIVVARAPRRARRAEAGPPPHPLRHARRRAAPRPPAHEVRVASSAT